jgi:hypothetical protein
MFEKQKHFIYFISIVKCNSKKQTSKKKLLFKITLLYSRRIIKVL